MKLTIDIDEDLLNHAMRYTGEKKKGPAVVKAANEFIKRQLSAEFATRVMEGEFGDYPLTNDEIEDFDR
ncbi:MAG: type II toxin-antitoxin system VapB family antitoxin [Verrucomicrobiota bacterium]